MFVFRTAKVNNSPQTPITFQRYLYVKVCEIIHRAFPISLIISYPINFQSSILASLFFVTTRYSSNMSDLRSNSSFQGIVRTSSALLLFRSSYDSALAAPKILFSVISHPHLLLPLDVSCNGDDYVVGI